MTLYTLVPNSRRFLQDAFSKPFPVEELDDTERWRGFTFVARLPDGQLLVRTASRAFVRIGVLDGQAAAWVEEDEETSRTYDRLFSYRFSLAARDRLLAALRVGAVFDDALRAASGPEMPTIIARDRNPLDGGGVRHTVFFANAGVVTAETDNSGHLVSSTLLSGPDAFDTWLARQTSRPPVKREGPALPARTRAEVALFLRVKQYTAPRTTESREGARVRLTVQARRDDVDERLVFLVDEPDGPDPTHLGGGAHSRILDPVHLVLFASGVADHIPADLSDSTPAVLRALVADLTLAAEALDEVTKFIPPGHDRVLPEAMHTHTARRMYQRDPARFSRQRLNSEATRLRTEILHLQHALDHR